MMELIDKHPKGIAPFELFGTAHVVTVLIMAVIGAAILLVARKYSKPVKYFLLISLIIMDLSYRLWGGLYQSVHLDVLLTLHLSSAAVFLSIVLLIHFNQKAFDVLIYWAFLAVPQAIITPGITRYGFPHLRFFHILWIHITVILVVLFLLLIEKKRPSKKSLQNALIVTHLYGAGVFFVNMYFHTNYMFIGRKTSAQTLIDFLGPWPWYIVILDFILILCFIVLSRILNKIYRRD